jgi:hypothetical protein
MLRYSPSKKGDILAVLVTGAYNYAMSSHYNGCRSPPIVSIRDKNDRVAVKRETYEDLLKNEILLEERRKIRHKKTKRRKNPPVYSFISYFLLKKLYKIRFRAVSIVRSNSPRPPSFL